MFWLLSANRNPAAKKRVAKAVKVVRVNPKQSTTLKVCSADQAHRPVVLTTVTFLLIFCFVWFSIVVSPLVLELSELTIRGQRNEPMRFSDVAALHVAKAPPLPVLLP